MMHNISRLLTWCGLRKVKVLPPKCLVKYFSIMCSTFPFRPYKWKAHIQITYGHYVLGSKSLPTYIFNLLLKRNNIRYMCAINSFNVIFKIWPIPIMLLTPIFFRTYLLCLDSI